MDKFREQLEHFMEGRYGIDDLNKCLFVIYMVCFVLNILTKDPIFYVIGFLIVIYLFYRCLSKNHEARRKENEKVVKITGKVSKKTRLYKRMWADRHTHVYRRCPHCKAMIRLPKQKGEHTTTCPRCHKDFKVKV